MDGRGASNFEAAADGSAAAAEAGTALSPRLAAILVGLIVVAALALRLPGRGYLLPHAPNSDERVFYYQLQELRGHPPPPAKVESSHAYPTLIARACDAVLPRSSPTAGAGVDALLADASRDLLGIRTVLAVLTSLGVLAVYAFARRFLGRPASLAASALFAGSLLHAWYSPQARPHALLGVLTLCSVLAAIHIRQRRTVWSCLLLGASAGAAIGCVQSGASVLPVIAAAYLLRDRMSARRGEAWMLLALALVAASAFVFYDFGPAIDLAATDASWTDSLRVHNIQLGEFRGAGFGAIAAALWSYDPLILTLGLTGLAVVLTRSRFLRALEPGRRRDVYVVIAHALPYCLAFGLFDLTFQRFTIPLLPYLACLAGHGLVEGGAALARATSRAWWRSAVPIAAVTIQLAACARLAWLRAAPDTQSQAAAWIREHVAPAEGKLVIALTLELPILRRPDAIPAHLVHHPTWFALWTEYQLARGRREGEPDAYDLVDVPLLRRADREAFEADPAGFVGGLGARYAIVEVMSDSRRPILARLRDAVRARGTLVGRFGPREEVVGTDPPILAEHDGFMTIDERFAWRALRYAAQGPEIEIYRIDP